MRKYFLYKAHNYIRQAIELNIEKTNMVALYGNDVKNTLMYQSTELAEALANLKYNICVSFLPKIKPQ